VLKDESKAGAGPGQRGDGEGYPLGAGAPGSGLRLFNHSVHVNRGISCVECHGSINKMEEVTHAQPLSMTFCLDCHRDPAAKVRPLDKITDLDWKWSTDPDENARQQKAAAASWSMIGRSNRSRIAPLAIDENESSRMS